MLPTLIFPSYNFRLKEIAKQTCIWDGLRKKYVALTPEEWVRQHLINYLIHSLGYSAGLVSVEGGVNINNNRKRTDVVIYNTSMQPLLLAECKAPDVDISQKTFDQIAVYNLQLNAKLLVLTNGIKVFCCTMDHINKKWHFLNAIPSQLELSRID